MSAERVIAFDFFRLMKKRERRFQDFIVDKFKMPRWWNYFKVAIVVAANGSEGDGNFGAPTGDSLDDSFGEADFGVNEVA